MNERQQSAIEEFPRVAREFCELVESTSLLTLENLLLRLAMDLAQLYAVAVCSPYVDPETAGLDEANVDQDKLAAIRNSLQSKLENVDLYWDVFDPTKDKEAIHASLVNDILEVYEDLAEAMALSDRKIPASDLHWDWQEGFRQHWGRHALGTLRVLHWTVWREVL